MQIASLRIGPALAAFALGCSVTPADYSSDADTGSTHGLISIERSQTENTTEGPRATAFAGFVRTPPEVDANAMMQLAGFGLDLPALGQCAKPNRERGSSMPLSPLGRVEFLDAGDVILRTATTRAQLATRAFPAVTDLIAGVVYTTRDRAPDPLPPAASYLLSTSGGVLKAVAVTVTAPTLLSSVIVGSTPLAELATVSIHTALPLTWDPGSGHDLVYVEFTTEDGSASTRCTFRDDAGAGRVPAGTFSGLGTGQFSLHRVHREVFTSGGVDAGEVRFDFEQSANVEFND